MAKQINELDPINLSVPQAAKLLGISTPTLYQIIHKKGFPRYHIGGRVVIPYEDLKQWAHEQATEEAAQ